jgi:hypothetical protein
MELFAAISFGRSGSGAPLTGAFSAPRMRTPLGPSRTSWSLHRTVPPSDALVVTRRHARAASVPSDALSVGERLSARFRLSGRPVGRCMRGPSPVSAIVVSFQVPSLAIPAIRVVRKEEDRRSYSLPSAWVDHVPAHRSPTPFQRRGCELPLDLLGPRGAFTEPRRPPDVLVVARGHARPASVLTDALSVTRSLRMA